MILNTLWAELIKSILIFSGIKAKDAEVQINKRVKELIILYPSSPLAALHVVVLFNFISLLLFFFLFAYLPYVFAYFNT